MASIASGRSFMAQPARLAIGTIQPGADPRPVFWALAEYLRREGIQVQGFLPEASFAGYRSAMAATGLNPRHLDSWLMSPPMCRELFDRGSQSADLAIVYGRFGADGAEGEDRGGRLEPLCRWLNLPRVAIVDAAEIRRCTLPPRPDQAEGLLLDRVQDAQASGALAVDFEALWGIPVLGALPELPWRRAVLDESGPGCSRSLCRELGNRFLPLGLGRAVRGLIGRGLGGAAPRARAGRSGRASRTTVAVAYDDALHCYFPDVLEQLELRGAAVVDFSPLHDEALPDGTDLVYLGCGCPERSAAALAANHCMGTALRAHVRRGGRVYAEGGGLAYLCQEMETAEGGVERMVGIIPARASLVRKPGPPRPAEITLARSNWLGPPGVRLRGYRNPRWRLAPAGPLAGLGAEPESQGGLVGSFNAVGSLLHLHFAAMPELLDQFLRPCAGCCALPDPWTGAQ